jgi:hypothetical protein
MGIQTKLVLMVITVVVALPVAAICFGQSRDCTDVRRELERNRHLLTEYKAALSKLELDGDRVMVTLLNHKIRDLRRQIEKGENSADCTDDPTVSSREAGLSRVRSDEALISHKSCGDLRNILVQLLRKSYVLERRRFSMFSEMSTQEVTELQEIRDSLRTVRAMLKAKCPPQPAIDREKPRRSSQERLSPPAGN